VVVGLCQRANASCGACCGLYNRADLSRRAVEASLERSTRALAGAPRAPAAFAAAAKALSRASGLPVFDSVRVCPLLGFIDREARRVGCLGHPAVTGGVDLRVCGAYDVLTCHAFLCPSHAFLGEDDAAVVEQATARDPYLYGLVVSDAPFVLAVLAAVAAEAGSAVRPAHLADTGLRAALAALLALKEALEPGSDGLYGAFHPPRGPAREGEERPGAATIVAALGADARSGNEEEALEAEAERRLEACVRALRRHLRAASGSAGSP
jgi:hypothetical protein